MEKLFKEVGKIVQQSKITQKESLKRGECFNVFSAVRVDHYEMFAKYEGGKLKLLEGTYDRDFPL